MKVEHINQNDFEKNSYGIFMSKAFINEPNFVYVIPNDEKRKKALVWFFGTFVSRLGF